MKIRTNQTEGSMAFGLKGLSRFLTTPARFYFFDQDHSKGEDRFILLGISASVRTLVVVYCERNKGKVVRIISARKATKKEIKRYEKGV